MTTIPQQPAQEGETPRTDALKAAWPEVTPDQISDVLNDWVEHSERLEKEVNHSVPREWHEEMRRAWQSENERAHTLERDLATLRQENEALRAKLEAAQKENEALAIALSDLCGQFVDLHTRLLPQFNVTKNRSYAEARACLAAREKEGK